MSHFLPSEWVDSVRGLLPPGRTVELQSHLDQRCPDCVEALGFWSRLAELLARESTYRPPGHLLRAVENLYIQQKPGRWLRAAARWAELVFDSFQQPSMAFVRGLARSDRHLVYEAAPFVIDVTLKTDAKQNSMSMVGQILRSENSDQGTSEVHVVLLSGEELIAKTVASENGEFALECDAHPNLNLFISIRGDRAIGISLCDSMNGQNSKS